MSRNDVLDDQVRLRRRLASLATAMDLTPEGTGGMAGHRPVGAPRPRRGVALLAAAAAIGLVVAAVATVGTLRTDDRVEVVAAGSPTAAPPSIAPPAPAITPEVSSLPLVTPVRSTGLSLSRTGSWPGPANRATPRSSPEEAVRSYLTAAIGQPAAAATTLSRLPVVDSEGAVTFFATLPSGATVTLQTYPEPSGQWGADGLAIGTTGTAPTAVPGGATSSASELSLPVVQGAQTGRLWYHAQGTTWQMDLGPDIMGVITPPMSGLEGDEASIRVLIPTPNMKIDGIVLVYLDGAGQPIALHSVSDMH